MFTFTLNRRQFRRHREAIQQLPSPYLPPKLDRDQTLKLKYELYGIDWSRIHNMLDNLTSIYADPSIEGTVDRKAIDAVQSQLIALLAKLDTFKTLDR